MRKNASFSPGPLSLSPVALGPCMRPLTVQDEKYKWISHQKTAIRSQPDAAHHPRRLTLDRNLGRWLSETFAASQTQKKSAPGFSLQNNLHRKILLDGVIRLCCNHHQRTPPLPDCHDSRMHDARTGRGFACSVGTNVQSAPFSTSPVSTAADPVGDGCACPIQLCLTDHLVSMVALADYLRHRLHSHLVGLLSRNKNMAGALV